MGMGVCWWWNLIFGWCYADWVIFIFIFSNISCGSQLTGLLLLCRPWLRARPGRVRVGHKLA
jgi:hypothetical protein